MRMTFIRHGKTAGNMEHRYVGRTNQELCDEGIAGVRQKKYDYKNLADADVVFVSPMKRCIQTAEILFEDIRRIGKPVNMIKIEDFREYDFGEFEGKNHEELMEFESYRKWLEDNGSYDLPAGEGMENFRKRVINAFDYTVNLCHENSYENVVYVAHGGTIMTIFEKYDSEKCSYYDYMCKNAEGYIAWFDGKILERVDK